MSAIVKVERQGAGAVFRAKLAPNCAGERDENMLAAEQDWRAQAKQAHPRTLKRASQSATPFQDSASLIPFA
jgi:hypothetical protein